MVRLLSVLMVMLAFLPLGSKAQQAGAGNIPDFRRCFEVLKKNRTIYNQYNDSIFLIKEHDRWVNFFRHRAVKNHQIFTSNKEVLKEVVDYFSQPHDMISTQAYVQFKDCMEDYFYSGKTDSFILLEFCKLMKDYAKHAPDSLNFNNNVNIWEAVSHYMVSSLGGDSLSVAKAYHCLKNNLTEQAKAYPDYSRGRMMALWNLIKPLWVPKHLQTLEENRWAYQELLKMMRSMDVSKLLTSEEELSMRASVSQYQEQLVRNLYMVDSTLMDKQEADSLMRYVVKKYTTAKMDVSLFVYQRTLLMRHRLGEMTADEALEKLLKRYKVEKKALGKTRLNDVETTRYLTVIFTLLYFNDLSSKSFADRRSLVLRLCHDAEWGFKNRKDGQTRTFYVRQLNQMTTYPRLVKYLTEKERIHFLDALNVVTQVTTYAHSVHVSLIAEALMKGVLKYEPQLLAGTLGHTEAKDIRRNKREYLDFIHDAAMYHDLGKNSIISVVNNDYRPLTDEEFDIIKRHPQLGLQYLDLSPSLEKFHDTTLGHHKWYNGKGGYPEDFDNTKSPVRIMIDIVTLSDCMQAATEQVGRNYKGEKTFDTVMGEFRRDAGVRYNPDLVRLIDDHPDVASQLAELIDDGWVEIYYDIYRQFIK